MSKLGLATHYLTSDKGRGGLHRHTDTQHTHPHTHTHRCRPRETDRHTQDQVLSPWPFLVTYRARRTPGPRLHEITIGPISAKFVSVKIFNLFIQRLREDTVRNLIFGPFRQVGRSTDCFGSFRPWLTLVMWKSFPGTGLAFRPPWLHEPWRSW